MKKMIEMLVPTVEGRKEKKFSLSLINDLDNKVMGIQNNGWPTFNIFLKRTEELLSERYKSLRFVRRTKTNRTLPIPIDMFDDLASSCQVVINGLGG